jgi:hypothetical protein
MSWITVAGVAISAGTAAYSANQQNKQGKAVRQGYADAQKFASQNPGVFGEKIDFEAIEYSPRFREDPGYAQIAGDTIAGNQRNLPANLTLMRDTNKAITEDAQTRINTLYPQFQGQFNQQSMNTSNLLRGQIPFEDQQAMTARRSEATSLGGGGNSQQQTLADLGISRLEAMQSGAANLTNNINLWNSIDPISRRVNPQSLFVDVGQAINSAVQENQFGATFAASERDAAINYAAMPDPQLAGQLNLMTGAAGAAAASPMQSVGGAALMAGANAGFGAYQANNAGASWNQPQQQSPYVSTGYRAPTYGSAADQTAGFQALSGGTAPAVSTYNPQTGTSYGQQGGLWSFFAGNNNGQYRQKY